MRNWITISASDHAFLVALHQAGNIWQCNDRGIVDDRVNRTIRMDASFRQHVAAHRFDVAYFGTINE
jgi:hypothetical protein